MQVLYGMMFKKADGDADLYHILAGGVTPADNTALIGSGKVGKAKVGKSK